MIKSGKTRRTFLKLSSMAAVTGPAMIFQDAGLVGRIERSILWNPRQGGRTYFQPRACRIPSEPDPTVLMTCSPVTGDDVFWSLHWSESKDLGTTWSTPKPIPGLARRKHPGGAEEELICDAAPEYHARTGVVLVMGDNVYYAADGKTQTQVEGHRWQVPVCLVRTAAGEWLAPQKLDWDYPGASAMINCGNTQRVNLSNGDILMALSYAPVERYAHGPLGGLRVKGEDRAVCTVLCSFDGRKLEIRKRSDEFRLPVGRGFIEPSLSSFQNRFFITLRAEDGHGYVSVSSDGIHWKDQSAWCWDDGEPLTMSTTQQRWLVHSDGLFLVYTRKAVDNVNIARWRAPLYMAQVDVQRLRLIRATEQIVFPMLGDGLGKPDQVARMGNFSTVEVTPEMSLVLVTEETSERERWRGNTLIARIHWKQPNRLVQRGR